MNLENPTAEEQQKYYAFFMRKGFSYACGTQGSAGARIIRRIFLATIKEIAEKAGVSTTTVSNVIHGKTKSITCNDPEDRSTDQRSWLRAKRGLRVLNNEKSQLIAVVINYHKEFKDSILGDPFYGKIIGFIEEYVQKQGYYLMLYSTKDIEEIFQMVAGWDVDGVIAISFSRHNCEKDLSADQKPIVSIDAYGNAPKTAIWSISVWMTKVAAIRW